MKKLINFLSSNIKYILLIYFLAQVAIVLTIDSNYGTDARYYYKLASECIDRNEFYPAKINLYEDYIVAPLYINILIILLKIYNSSITISAFNLMVILFQIYFLYQIALKLFSENNARLTLILFLFYFNTLALMLQNYTELLFLLLISGSIYFYLRNNNLSLILSGIFLGASIAVRPIGWALLLSFIVIHIYKIMRSKKLVASYFYIYAGTLVFVFLFGVFIYTHFGQFEYSSTTGPINLLLGANDDATGAFNSIVLQKGKAGYIEFSDSLNYLQKGEFYQEKAFEWIKENPVKWILLSPLKFFHTYGWDDVSLSSLLGFDNTNFLRVMRILVTEKDFNKALPKSSTFEKFFYFLILILSQLYYYFLLLSAVIGISKLFRQKLLTESNCIILLYVLFASLMIMITVGTPRYKYPLFILLLPYAAYYIQSKFLNGNRKVEQN